MESQSASEYHHYIPRFILYRFAIDPPGRSHDKKQKQKLKRNAKVKAVDLTKNPSKILTAPVARIFGQQDMYKDHFKPTAQEMHVEKKLFEIERDVGVILAKICYAHEDGMNKISLLRCEKDLLCKFAFVSRYRGPIFFERFNHQTPEDYNSKDREPFLEYMKRKNFKRPLDVWFDNLTKIINIPMDASGKWVMDLARNIYPGDAIWISLIIWSMHLVFVSPSDPNEEFILTENAFGIHEGPTTYSIGPSTNKRITIANTEFHLLHVISPRLAMILRDNTLPEPSEDQNEELRAQKSEILAEQARRHFDPAHARSMLHNLPVARARCSNPSARNRVDALLEFPGDDASAADTFEFPYFRLASDHVQTINSVMLDQAHNISKLVFRSESALRKAVEFYLEYPTQANGGHSRKTISGRKDDPMLLLFQKLEKLVHSLGSDVEAKYYVDASSDDDEEVASMNERMTMKEAVFYVLKTAKPVEPDKFLAFAMQFMSEILSKSELKVLTVHMWDLESEGDGLYSFPQLIFASLQNAAPKCFNRDTKTLLDHNLVQWTFAWSLMIEYALRDLEQHLNQEDEEKPDLLTKIGYPMSKGSVQTLPHTQAAHTLRVQQVDHANTQHNQMQDKADRKEPKYASGFSKLGLRNAFEDIGRTLENEEARPSGPATTVETHPQRKDSAIHIKSRDTFFQTSEKMQTVDEKLTVDNSSSLPVERADDRISTTTTLNSHITTVTIVSIVVLAWLYFLLQLGTPPLT